MTHLLEALTILPLKPSTPFLRIILKVYSNAREVELFLNGMSRGLKTNDGNAVFIWKQVGLQPGENKVESRAQFADTNLTDRCVWHLTNAR